MKTRKPKWVRVNSSFTPDFVKALKSHCKANKLNRSKYLERCAMAGMLQDSLHTGTRRTK